MLSLYLKEVGVGAALFTSAFLIPQFSLNTDVNTLVSATSAVFAIVAGFFIADAMSNYLRLQTLIAEENAALITIVANSKKIDPRNESAVRVAVDAYMIAQLEAGTLNHILRTEKEVDNLSAALDALQVSEGGKELYDHVLTMREKIMSARQEILLAAKENLSSGHWITLIVLGVLVVFTVLAIRDGGAFMNMVAGAMMVGMYSILVLLRDMDNNRLLELKLGFDNPREFFHALDLPPYYPRLTPAHYLVPDDSGTYRIGDGKGGFELVHASKGRDRS